MPAAHAGAGFNGAALRRARSHRGSAASQPHEKTASTGPRSGERGVEVLGEQANIRIGALQRGRAPESAESSPESVVAACLISLQRGRAPESAESFRWCPFSPLLEVASTGPRSGERGVADALGASQSRTSFNGAALRRARSLNRSGHVFCVRAPLQRGRAPESAESPSCGSQPTPCRRASTGPRSGERGVVHTAPPFGSECVLLQRGRAPESAESRVTPSSNESTGALQRGRAPESAESRPARSRLDARQGLQRGRAPESAESGAGVEGVGGSGVASTGPRSGERGVPRPRAGSRRAPSCFNGAALRRARSRV